MAERPTTNTNSRDPQQQYDDDLSEFTNGQEATNNDKTDRHFGRSFPRDFFRYSQDFHDREDGAPGIDEDFATLHPVHAHETLPPSNLMPEGDGDSESAEDRGLREEIMAVFTRDFGHFVDDVSVRVEDGVVTVSGKVPSVLAKRGIANAIEAVPGVERVRDCLLVNSGYPA